MAGNKQFFPGSGAFLTDLYIKRGINTIITLKSHFASFIFSILSRPIVT